MKKTKIIEFYKDGLDYGMIVPKGTKMEDIDKMLGWCIVELAKYRKIETPVFIKEITDWVEQLDANL